MTRLALLLMAMTLLAAPAARGDGRPTLPDVEDEVMCTVCGTLLEMSESPQADRERHLIQSLIDQGKNKDEIKDALVAEYGQRVLAEPGTSGFDLTAWLIPAIALASVVGAAAIWVARHRRTRAAPIEPLDPLDDARLRAEMGRDEI